MNEDRLEKMLRENMKIARGNNEMLRKLRRAQKLGNIKRFIYLVVVIILGIVGYSYLKPYIEGLTKAYQSVQEGVETIQQVNDDVRGSGLFGGRNNE